VASFLGSNQSSIGSGHVDEQGEYSASLPFPWMQTLRSTS
jgi:hypothetical protein